jgi:hypothetical protein
MQHLGLIGALLLALSPATVEAQSDFKNNITKIVRKVGVHANASVRESADPDVSRPAGIGVSVVLGGGRKEGLKFPVGLTSFSENLHAPSGAQFGSLKAWVILGGVGYGWNAGKLSTGVDLQTGVAFNSGRLEGSAAQAFATEGPISIDVGNSLVLRPRVKAEYFITPKFTLRTTADYVLTKPGISVATAAGTFADRWDASHFHASIGIGFYPFRR